MWTINSAMYMHLWSLLLQELRLQDIQREKNYCRMHWIHMTAISGMKRMEWHVIHGIQNLLSWIRTEDWMQTCIRWKHFWQRQMWRGMKNTGWDAGELSNMWLAGHQITNGGSRNIIQATGNRIWSATRLIRMISSNHMGQHRGMVWNGRDWSRSGRFLLIRKRKKKQLLILRLQRSFLTGL